MSDPTKIKLPNVPETTISAIRYVTRSADESRLLKEIADAALKVADGIPNYKVAPHIFKTSDAKLALLDFGQRLREMAEE